MIDDEELYPPVEPNYMDMSDLRITVAMIMAQEQRLKRIAEVESIPKSERTIWDFGLLTYLRKRIIVDFNTYMGGRWKKK